MNPKTTAAVLAMLLAATPVMAEGPAWVEYGNARFGFSICYPADLLVPQGESDNGDGQTFAAADGAVLAAWGHHDVLDETVKDAMARTAGVLSGQGAAVSYQAVGKHWYVLSGTQDQRIFYEKSIRTDGQFVAFRLTYPATAAQRYAPVVKRLAGCLRAWALE